MFKKIIIYGTGSLGSSLISFMITPFLTRVLSTTDYGKGSLFITIISLLFYICNLGLDQGYVRFFYEEKTNVDRSKLFYQCLSISLIAFAILMIVLFSFNNIFLGFFFGNSSIGLFLCIFLGTLLYLINRYFSLSLRMQNKAIAFSIVQVFNSLLYFISIASLFFIYGFKNYELIIYAQLIGLFCVTVFSGIINIKTLLLFPIKKVFSIREISILLHFSWPFLFSLIIVWGMQYVDRIFLIKLSDFSQLGIYSASFALIAPLVMFQGVFTTLWAPLAMNLLINHSYRARVVYKVFFINMTTIIFIGMLLILSLKDIIPLLLGSKFAESSHIFIWLLFVPFFNLMDPILSAGISLSKKTHWNIWATLLGFIVNIISCIILIPIFGAMGAAIALALGNVFYILIKIISCMMYYKFRINYMRLFLSIFGLALCFSLASSDNYSYYVWIVFGVILIYQLCLFFSKSNIRDIKNVMNFMKGIKV